MNIHICHILIIVGSERIYVYKYSFLFFSTRLLCATEPRSLWNPSVELHVMIHINRRHIRYRVFTHLVVLTGVQRR